MPHLCPQRWIVRKSCEVEFAKKINLIVLDKRLLCYPVPAN
ncbi:MAG TPA: hypothetical protein VIJ38_02360 [Acidobacteriaceae bacterium]